MTSLNDIPTYDVPEQNLTSVVNNDCNVVPITILKIGIPSVALRGFDVYVSIKNPAAMKKLLDAVKWMVEMEICFTMDGILFIYNLEQVKVVAKLHARKFHYYALDKPFNAKINVTELHNQIKAEDSGMIDLYINSCRKDVLKICSYSFNGQETNQNEIPIKPNLDKSAIMDEFYRTPLKYSKLFSINAKKFYANISQCKKVYPIAKLQVSRGKFILSNQKGHTYTICEDKFGSSRQGLRFMIDNMPNQVFTGMYEIETISHFKKYVTASAGQDIKCMCDPGKPFCIEHSIPNLGILQIFSIPLDKLYEDTILANRILRRIRSMSEILAKKRKKKSKDDLSETIDNRSNDDDTILTPMNIVTEMYKGIKEQMPKSLITPPIVPPRIGMYGTVGQPYQSYQVQQPNNLLSNVQMSNMSQSYRQVSGVQMINVTPQINISPPIQMPPM